MTKELYLFLIKKMGLKFRALVLFSMVISIAFCSSCFIDCEGIKKEQLLKFGDFTLQINTPQDTLAIGDSIHFQISIPSMVYDSVSTSKVPIEEIEMLFRVTRDTEEVADTSLIYVFDQYFDISIKYGEKLNPYQFILEENNSEFKLDFSYICKKKMKYYIRIKLEELIAKDVDTNCMSGDTETWDAKAIIESDFNTINQDEFPSYFGFVVN